MKHITKFLYLPALSAASLAALLTMSGCVVDRPARIDRIVYTAPAPRADIVLVETEPPPPREELVIARPSPAHVWIGGYWAWSGGRHTWIAGRWDLPPRPGSVWVEPRWERREHGYVFISGRWHNAAPVVNERIVVSERVAAPTGASIRIVAQPPPPVRREEIVYSIRPSSEHLWIKGYWVWHGDGHVWVSGHWAHPPHARAVWVEPRWERREHGYVFVDGYWR